MAGDQEVAVQDEVERLRLRIRQARHRRPAAGISVLAAVQDDLHGRVAFQGEGQQHLLAEEILPVQDDGDADGFGGWWSWSAVSHQLSH